MLLIGPVLLKIGTTGYRLVRYYASSELLAVAVAIGLVAALATCHLAGS